MLFNSLQFFIFFLIVTPVYYLLPHRWRWLHLLISSCLFYCAFIPVYIFILFFTIAIDYVAGIMIENASGKKRKTFLTMSIVANVGVLAIFKYYNFFAENVTVLLGQLHITTYAIPLLNIILPLGLSFHTFQAMSYTIEVYRGNQKAEKHFGIYALYVMFYPQLVAGPIERPQNMLHQFHEEHQFDYVNLLTGLRLMLWGLFKKVVVADRVALYVNEIYAHPGNFHYGNIILALIFFAIQVYCDFSGYSDIALGSAKTMGFDLMLNFNRPFVSKNITEFWRRWHISLSTWFNDYLFTPITIAQRDWGKYAIIFALITTFFISGLWHGAGWTFIIYGLLHGLAMTYEFLSKKIRKKISKNIPILIYNPISQLITFCFLVLAWVFFRSPDFETAMLIIKKIALLDSSPAFAFTLIGSSIYGKLYFSLTALVVIALFSVEYFTSVSLKEFNRQLLPDILFCTTILTAIVIFGVFKQTSFIYFQF